MSLRLLIRIFTNSFWAVAVTGRIPEGCSDLWKGPELQSEKKEGEREIQQQGLTEFCLACGSLHSITFFSAELIKSIR